MKPTEENRNIPEMIEILKYFKYGYWLKSYYTFYTNTQ